MAGKESNVGARLTLIVEYDVDMIPSESEIEEVLDSARSYGRICQATFQTLALVKKELV
jgi:hypothetical protein